jgi:hypothetical protein
MASPSCFVADQSSYHHGLFNDKLERVDWRGLGVSALKAPKSDHSKCQKSNRDIQDIYKWQGQEKVCQEEEWQQQQKRVMLMTPPTTVRYMARTPLTPLNIAIW